MLDPPTLLRWALAVWALAATSVTGAALGAPGTRAPAASASVAWAVQVSDLHISGFKHLAIAPDLVAFGESVLAALRPSALLLTGDLVDAKTASQEGSQQYPQEWQAYAAAWRGAAAAAGLDASHVIDMRGNHDVFDAARGEPSGADGFAESSATAAALGAAGVAARVRVTEIAPRLVVRLGGGADADVGGGTVTWQDEGGGGSSCPAAVLIGVDATPDVRMYGYTNFFGVINATNLEEVEAALAAAPGGPGDARCGGAAASAEPPLSSSSSSLSSSSAAAAAGAGAGAGAAAGAAAVAAAVAARAAAAAPAPPTRPPPPPPPRLSYTHYPLGTIASAPRPGLPGSGGRALARLLARRGVAGHLSGHLHSLAGRFMYARHRFFAERNAGDGGAGMSDTLAEFEAGDWKLERRWRLLAFDGPGVVVADYDFKGGRVHSLERSASVASHVVVVTAALVAADGGSPSPAAPPNVRALVLPVDPAAPAVAHAALRWQCSAAPGRGTTAAGEVPLQEGTTHPAVAEAAPSPAQGRRRQTKTGGVRGDEGDGGNAAGRDARLLYVGTLVGGAAAACGSRLWVQAVVTDAAGNASASSWREAARSPDAAAGAHAAGFEGQSALERPGLRAALMIAPLDWPLVTRLAEVAGWAFHLVVLILIPSCLAGPILSVHARLAQALPLTPGCAGRRCGAALARRAGSGGESGGLAALGAADEGSVVAAGPRRQEGGGSCGLAAVKGVVVNGGRLILLLCLWPVKTMAEFWARTNAAGPGCLAAALAFNLLLLTGPWHLAHLSGGEAGLGALFPWGLLMRPAGGGFMVYECADPSIPGMVFIWVALVPLTVWLALVSNTYARDDRKPAPAWATALVSAALLVPAALWAKLALRLGLTYGPSALLVSPFIGWAPLLTLGWLLLSWRRPPAATPPPERPWSTSAMAAQADAGGSARPGGSEGTQGEACALLSRVSSDRSSQLES